MNQDAQFTVKFHHDRYVSIANNQGYEIYEVTDNVNLQDLKTKNFLRKIYKQSEKIKMLEPLYLFEPFLLAVIKENDGDILELRDTKDDIVIFSNQSYSTPVLSIGSTSEKLLVCLESCIYLYSLANDQRRSIHSSFYMRLCTPYLVNTPSNPNGIFALSRTYYAVPDNSLSGIIKILTLNNKCASSTLRAHSEPVSAIAFDSSENYIATAPKSGTVIMVYYRCTASGQPIAIFQRGITYANISSLSFNEEFRYLACSSDRTTIHVFRLTEEKRKTTWMDYVYTSGERAYYTAQLPKADLKSCLLFKSISPIKLLAITNEGCLKLYSPIRSNAGGGELALIKEEMLDLAMCNKNITNLQ